MLTLSQIVTTVETWVHHFEPETKGQSIEFHHPQSPRRKEFQNNPSAGKVMITVFWNCEGVILVDVMPRGETFNSNAYIRMVTDLRKHSNGFGVT
jgi:hypothetical protein